MQGAEWQAANAKWRAAVQIAGTTHYLGLYDDEREAARVAADFRRQHMPFSEADRNGRAPAGMTG